MSVLIPGAPGALAVDPATAPRLIVCFCAEWCGTCRTYLSAFTQLSEKYAQDCFVWVDIEAQPELVGDVDIENFPTLLVMDGANSVFFGPMLPHIGHLDRLLTQTPDITVEHDLPDLRQLLGARQT